MVFSRSCLFMNRFNLFISYTNPFLSASPHFITYRSVPRKGLNNYLQTNWLHNQTANTKKDNIDYLKGLVERTFSRFSAATIMTGTDTFHLTDYNMMGFDLDNTLVRYKITEMVQLEYEVLSDFLINKRNYPAEWLRNPIDFDFLRRGLIIDMERGNLLKISPDGYIQRASHGTKFMGEEEIIELYGEDRKWDIVKQFTDNLLITWNGPLSEKMRALLDFFDIPSALLFARIVDGLDEKAGKRLETYNIWPSILEALVEIYSRDNFENRRSKYFEAMRRTPDRYVYKAAPKLIEWLKIIKRTKKIYLLTGSHIDFVNLTASYAFGEDWQDLFDIIVVFARKPGFFHSDRPFVEIDGIRELGPIDWRKIDLKQSKVYSQGNYQDLANILLPEPMVRKSIYFGDNVIQDVYAPVKYGDCDTVAIIEELMADGITDPLGPNNDLKLLQSSVWGSYWGDNDDESLWLDIIRRHSKLCVPTVDLIAMNPLDYQYKYFTAGYGCANGFFPHPPNNLPNY